MFYARRATNFFLVLGESWALAKSQSLHSHTSHSKSHQQKKKKRLKKGKIPNSKGSSTQGRITWNPSVSLVKSLCNIPNIMLLDYDISRGEGGDRRCGEGITVLPSGYSAAARCFTITVVTLHTDAPWHHWHSEQTGSVREGTRKSGTECVGVTRVVRHIINFKLSGHPNRGSLLLGNIILY